MVEYYSAIKKNQILPFVITLMSLEGIMLSEISQIEKDKYRMISPIYENTQTNKNPHRNRVKGWLPGPREWDR